MEGATQELLKHAATAAAHAETRQLQVSPAEQVVYEPVGISVGRDKREDDEVVYEVQYLISPFKVVTVRLGEDAKKLLIEGLTGGIALA